MKTLLRLLAFAAATVAAFGVQTTVLFDVDTGRLKRPLVILPADGGVPSGGQTGYVLTKVSGSDYDYTWSAAGAGAGTVTSVGLSMPAIFQVADSPVTTSGTIAVTFATQSANLVFAGPNTGSAAAPTFRALVAADLPTITALGTISTGVWNGTAIAAAYGGTGQTSYTVGDLLYASTTTALSKLAAVATGQVLVSAGTGTAPAWSATPLLTGAKFSTGDIIMGNSGVWNGWAAVVGRGIYVQRDGVTGMNFFSSGGSSVSFIGLTAGGTIASPTATLQGSGFLPAAASFDGTNWYTGVRIQLITTEAQTGSNRGHMIQFDTILTGATSLAERMRISGAGNLLVGTTADTGLTGAGGLRIGSTTDATTSTAASLITAGGLGVAKKIITADSITTAAPSGGTAAPWKFGTVASTSPTAPNRTIELDVNGTRYFIHAKTTND